MLQLKFFLAVIIIAISHSFAQTTFINTGAIWKYSTGTDLGTSWKDPVFNDTLWAQDSSQLGYGDGDEATVIPSGPAGNYYPTYYFRHTFDIPDPSSFPAFTLNVKRDDGIVVYVNGNEVFRDSMPAGTPTYNTLASSAASDDGNTWYSAILSSSAFVSGTNVISAEVHQASAASSDVSFDLQLIGGTPATATLLRGPYLQLGTPTSVYFRWRTNLRTDSKVKYGATSGNLNQTSADFFSTTEHTIQLTGLSPDTKYYYSIGSAGQALQGDTNNYFITAPVVGTEKITRIWATGDCGTAQSVQTNVRNAYQDFIGNNYTDLWLLLGDNAYENGTDGDYQSKFFQPYMAGKVMRQTVLFPAPGNHDYANNADSLESRERPYFQNFILPKAGEAGGLASGTEMYYSYNYANIHFISLDSYGTMSNKKMSDTTSVQIEWLKQDLDDNTQKWTILYWHHPPYTKGSHNSDTENDLEDIRERVIKLLDRYKVDLILCGHSHSYERSKIMKGHYGVDTTFNSTIHNASISSGLYDGSANSCPYVKSSDAPVNEGIVYVVAGSAGKLGGSSSGYPHNAMYYSNVSKGGSFYIEVDGNRLDAKWIAADSIVKDKFTILKDVNKSTNLTTLEGDNVDLAASWKGVYQWNPTAEVSKLINVSPADTTNYFVIDASFNCVGDTFKVNVIPKVVISGGVFAERDTPVTGVTITLSGDVEQVAVTGADGLYSFDVPQGGNYTVTPSKNNDSIILNGITTIDLALMQRHILAIDTLGSPYKIIAGDVNISEGVSTVDIGLIKRLILGIDLVFQSGKMWSFVRNGYDFNNDPMHPFPFENNIILQNVTTNKSNQKFIAVKMGDVNNSWNNKIP